MAEGTWCSLGERSGDDESVAEPVDLGTDACAQVAREQEVVESVTLARNHPVVDVDRTFLADHPNPHQRRFSEVRFDGFRKRGLLDVLTQDVDLCLRERGHALRKKMTYTVDSC